MTERILYRHHLRKNRREDKRRFRLFVLAQCVQLGALLLLFAGGLFFIIIALKVLF